jgi:hypothetical protein
VQKALFFAGKTPAQQAKRKTRSLYALLTVHSKLKKKHILGYSNETRPGIVLGQGVYDVKIVQTVGELVM